MDADPGHILQLGYINERASQDELVDRRVFQTAFPWRLAIFETFIPAYHIKTAVLMEADVSLPFSQKPAAGHCPEPDDSTPHLHSPLKYILILSTYLCESSKWYP